MILDSTLIQRWSSVPLPSLPATPVVPSRRLPEHDNAFDQAQIQARLETLFVGGNRPTPIEQEAVFDGDDRLDINFLDKCLLVSKSIAKVSYVLNRRRVEATGFLIAPGLFITNNHVIADQNQAALATILFDYRFSASGILQTGPTFRLNPQGCFITNVALDYTIIAVEETSSFSSARITDRDYIRLIPQTGKATDFDFVTIIQHPDGQPMRISLRENEVVDANSFKDVIWYRADTGHGTSGSPVLNDSAQLAALHSSGRIKRNANGEYALTGGGYTKSLVGLGERDVIWEANVGIRISRICDDSIAQAKAQWPAYQPVLERAYMQGGVVANAISQESTEIKTLTQEASMTDLQRGGSEAPKSTGANEFVVPLNLRIKVELGGPVASTTTPSVGSPQEDIEAEAWKMQIPVIYDDLESRDGFQAGFLQLGEGVEIDMPELTAAGEKIAAPLLDGSGAVLNYHHFSIVMHKKRRLALITASNVDWRKASRAINKGKTYTRKELSEIPDNVLEEWMPDSRLAMEHQLPDVFFTNDRGAFDKGHVVRRDDVTWGSSFEDIQMANGDTYHVTNCTPQTGVFNQDSKGELNWGEFESEVQKITKAEKVILFAGPILGPRDRWFSGEDQNGAVRIQIPSRFWKIIVSKGASGPQAYGFIFEQDVTSITEKELVISRKWEDFSVPISDIEGVCRDCLDFTNLKAIDQYGHIN
jgi:endonuclease G, mitochondrial